ncbi:hypothetical protein ACJX0J_032513 [Zea mays]
MVTCGLKTKGPIALLSASHVWWQENRPLTIFLNIASARLGAYDDSIDSLHDTCLDVQHRLHFIFEGTLHKLNPKCLTWSLSISHTLMFASTFESQLVIIIFILEVAVHNRALENCFEFCLIKYLHDNNSLI